jgi:hypothetical protein
VEARRVANLSACFGDMQGLEFNIEYAGIVCRLPISTAGMPPKTKRAGCCRCQRWSREILFGKKEVHHPSREIPRSFDHNITRPRKHYSEAKQVLQAAEIKQAEVQNLPTRISSR